jgi:hypothetical protein
MDVRSGLSLISFGTSRVISPEAEVITEVDTSSRTRSRMPGAWRASKMVHTAQGMALEFMLFLGLVDYLRYRE